MAAPSKWDGEQVEHAVQHLIEEIGSEYNISVHFTQERRIKRGISEKPTPFVEYELVPGSQKVTLVIRPKASTLEGRDKVEC